MNFSYIILTGMPLSQTIYGFILMLVGLSPLVTGDNPLTSVHPGTLLGIGIAEIQRLIQQIFRQEFAAPLDGEDRGLEARVELDFL